MNKYNFIKNLFLITFCLLFFSIQVKSQQIDSSSVYSFNLEKATQFALENNLTLKNAKIDKLSARKKVWETTAIGLPQISADYNFQHLPGELPTFQFGPNSAPIAFEKKNSANYDVIVSQLVFSGEYIVGLQASRTFLQLSENNLVKNTQDVKENVATNYFMILALEKNKEVLDTTIQNLENTYNEMKEMAKVGFVEQTDADQLLLTLNSTKNSLKSVERQIEIAYKLFKLTIGLDYKETLVLTDKLEDLLNNIDTGQLLSIQFNLNDNIDYSIINTQEKITKLSLKREQSKYLPTVSTFYRYYDKTKKATLDFTINHTIGLKVTMPIFSSGQRISKVGQAKLDLEKIVNTKNQVADNLLMQADQTKFDFLNAQEKLITQTQNSKLSKEVYQNTLTKFKEGMASSLDLTQAHNQYLNNQANYFNAVLSFLNAKIKLEKILNHF
ncbi:MAG: TolC family protein [Chlorobi bacterium]|nr:TolC family protein [Chlorobiota bacterium]